MNIQVWIQFSKFPQIKPRYNPTGDKGRAGGGSPRDEEAECPEEGDEPRMAAEEEHGEVAERHRDDEEEVGRGSEGDVGEHGPREPRVEVAPRGTGHGAPQEARRDCGREAEQEAEHGHRYADRSRHGLHLQAHRRRRRCRRRRRGGRRPRCGERIWCACSRERCVCVRMRAPSGVCLYDADGIDMLVAVLYKSPFRCSLILVVDQRGSHYHRFTAVLAHAPPLILEWVSCLLRGLPKPRSLLKALSN